ncbi:MAG: winged helix-turn-helix domain-containing protein [Candidatus Micrarchaeota archaeon]
MRVEIKRENGKLFLEIPLGVSGQFSSEGQGAEIYSLRDGVLLVCSTGARNEIFSHEAQPRYPAPAYNSRNFSLSEAEQALVNKLLRIRFFERTEQNVKKAINGEEENVLAQLLSRRAITIFKNSKYPQGVYNISNKIFFAQKPRENFSHGAPANGAPSSGAAQPSLPEAQSSAPEAQNHNANSVAGPALAINTVEHLQKLGYMVLSSEAEAKYLMEQIKGTIKDDDVKGVRGFDKKYYILRKSFLREFEQPIFDLLEQGNSHSKDIGERLGLTPEAITVILMVMADEGLVIERRRGEWAKA